MVFLILTSYHSTLLASMHACMHAYILDITRFFAVEALIKLTSRLHSTN